MQLPDGTLAAMLEVALKELGYVETPDNITKYGAAMGVQGQPWCGSYINWCAKEAGVALHSVVSTIAGAKKFKAAGKWFLKPKVGDLAFFDFVDDKKVVIQHIGLVVKVGEHSIVTIEGNTSDNGSQSNGGQVCMKTRKIGPNSFVVGYGRPDYQEAK
jgi:hypothetical protein